MYPAECRAIHASLVPASWEAKTEGSLWIQEFRVSLGNIGRPHLKPASQTKFLSAACFQVIATTAIWRSGFLFFQDWTWTQGLHLEPLHQLFFVMGFFEIGSLELFAQASFKLWSSWSLPPEYLGLQVWATVPGLLYYFKQCCSNHPWAYIFGLRIHSWKGKV
jgi:hypothetical protein